VTQESNDTTDTQSSDPTGAWAMARKIHEMASRNGAILTRRRPDPLLDDDDDSSSGTFADWFERNGSDATVQLALRTERTSTVLTATPPASGGWVPRPTVETGTVEPSPLDTPAPTLAVRSFPSMADPLELVRRSWPDGDEPIFDEVDSDVTHPRTPTGKLAKCGPKLPLTGGLPFVEFNLAVKENLRRVDARYHLGMAGLIDATDEA
jgi:hypothetical protein